jgi:transposase
MRKYRSFKPDQKARAVLQVLTGQKSPALICRELQISESLLARWKKQFLDGASSVFEKESSPAQDDDRVAELERLIGRLTLELEASKKVSQLLNSPRSKRGGGRDEAQIGLSHQNALRPISLVAQQLVLRIRRAR